MPSTANLGAYRLVRALGTGGMATVYEAEHVGLQKRVAVKVLRPELAASADMRARFLREGIAASRIRHPHVVDITDVGEHEGTPFLVMELLDGEPLTDVTARAGRLPTRRAVDILLPLLAALGDAHRAGVVHRDLKPDNIFLSRTAQGHALPKILDFGISRLFGRSAAQLTAQSQILGTPDFMSPEQARGEEKVGPASDQFSIAVVLFECLTGALPHPPDPSIVRVLRSVAFGDVIAPSHYDPDFDPDLEDVLMRALAPLPEARFPTIEDFGAALLPWATPRGRAAFVALTQGHEDALEPEPVSGGIFLPDPSMRTPRAGGVRVADDVPTLAHGELTALVVDPIDVRATTIRPPAAPEHRASDRRTATSAAAPAPAPAIAAQPAPARPMHIAPSGAASRAAQWAVVLGALTLASVVVASWLSRSEHADAAEGVAVVSSIRTPEPTAPDLAPSPASVTHDVVIAVTPTSAIIELGGIPAAVGRYDGAAPSEPTLVTVHAPGFVRHQFVLDGPTERTITLRAE